MKDRPVGPLVGAAILTVEGPADSSVFEVIKGSTHGGGH
jgi:hypothetical protein